MPLRPSLAILFAAALIACGGGEGRSLVTIVFTADGGGGVELEVEIADTPAERQQGLMFRESLPEDRGMLFDFGGETTAGFWMKDTSIPLSIAFVSAEGVVLDIQDMEPFSTELRHSPQRYRFAVEVNRGWFAENGIEVGSGVRIARATEEP